MISRLSDQLLSRSRTTDRSLGTRGTDAGRVGIDAQHACDVQHLRGGAGVPMGAPERRARGDGAGVASSSSGALSSDRRVAPLPVRGQRRSSHPRRGGNYERHSLVMYSREDLRAGRTWRQGRAPKSTSRSACGMRKAQRRVRRWRRHSWRQRWHTRQRCSSLQDIDQLEVYERRCTTPCRLKASRRWLR